MAAANDEAAEGTMDVDTAPASRPPSAPAGEQQLALQLQQQAHREFTPEEYDAMEAAAYALPFAYLVQKFEDVQQAHGAIDKTNTFFNKEFTQRLRALGASPSAPCSTYPFLVLMLPDSDPRQGQYKLKAAAMATIVIAALQLAPNGDTAQGLRRFADAS